MPKPNQLGIIVSMSNTTTTRAAGKIANRKNRKPAFSPRKPKPYTRKELAAEFTRLTGETHDPGYLADVASGTRMNIRLHDAVIQAIANLTKSKAST